MLLLSAVATTPLSTAQHVQKMIRSGNVPVRGVNLGSWLVGERWMSYNSPAWAGVDVDKARQGEYVTMQALGHEKGDPQFHQHRETWITRDDIEEIASYGLNTVRVPVGFWIVNEDLSTFHTEVSQVYAPHALQFLDELIFNWANDLNVSVMLSLHSHQGSQNGNDHSAPQFFGEQRWADSDDNYQSSIQFAEFLAFRYKNESSFLGLNLMNEPHYGGDIDRTATVKRYYEHAYKAIRGTGNDCIVVVSPNVAEQSPHAVWNDFMTDKELYQNVWHEFHPYYIWGHEGRNEDAIIATATSYADSILKPGVWNGNPILIGEWCLAGPASATFEAGGEHTMDPAKAMTDKTKVHAFAQAQLNSYEYAGAGWTFWAWRHDDEATMNSGWSMRQLLRDCDLVLPWQDASACVAAKLEATTPPTNRQ